MSDNFNINPETNDDTKISNENDSKKSFEESVAEIIKSTKSTSTEHTAPVGDTPSNEAPASGVSQGTFYSDSREQPINDMNGNVYSRPQTAYEAPSYSVPKQDYSYGVPPMGTGQENSYGGFSQKWNYEKNEAKSQKKSKGLMILAISMSALFLITFLGFIFYHRYVTENELPGKSNSPSNYGGSASVSDKVYNSPVITAPEISDVYTGEELSSQEIIALAKPSVVGVKSIIEEDYGWYGTQTYEGVGSGFIITSDGYIVTNYHVIEGAVSIKIVLSDGTEYDAVEIGSDPLSDVAVLKVDGTDLPALVIGDSDALSAGDTVIAIGCPSGIDLAGTATRGMISMVNRQISITDSYGNVQKMMSVIQTDAAINPGNSGGPLLNTRGEVIGINTLKLSATTYEGIGFALPINGVMKLVEQICENGAVVDRPADSFVTGKAALGITYRDITASESKRYDLPQGILVVLLSQGGAAQKSGMRSGDVIVAFDGKDIKTAEELIKILEKKKPGDVVSVKFYRDGEYMTVDATLTEASE
ncbi:MAG: PDZ domain-containing protein [Ruminococcaceae bacterium]|nr:PDZ domain-containing protein [Oscillospiraceae bacterium]